MLLLYNIQDLNEQYDNNHTMQPIDFGCLNFLHTLSKFFFFTNGHVCNHPNITRTSFEMYAHLQSMSIRKYTFPSINCSSLTVITSEDEFRSLAMSITVVHTSRKFRNKQGKIFEGLLSHTVPRS